MNSLASSGVYYQLSDNNGKDWLPQEIQIDDTDQDGNSVSSGSMEPSVFATTDRVHVVWWSNGRVVYKSARVDEAGESNGWGSQVGEYSSIAVNPRGYSYMSYYDSTFKNLMFSGSVGPDIKVGQFDTHTVDSSGDVGKYSSIDVEKRNYPYPHIAYYDETNGELKYARWTGSEWVTSVVDSVGAYTDVEGQYISIALDSNDIPHVCYHDENNGWLKYATGNTLSDIGIIDDGGVSNDDVGEFCSIAVDPNDIPHVSYYDKSNNDLNYAEWIGPSPNNWAILDPPLDSAGDVGKYSSIAVDEYFNVHISYSDETNVKLNYAIYDGNWYPGNIVDNDLNTGRYTSIALDPESIPYISYYDYDISHKRLKLAEWVGPGYGDWSVSVIDADGDVGMHSSLAIDSDSGIHIAYYDNTNSRLKYHGSTSSITTAVQREALLSYPWWGENRWGSNPSGLSWGYGTAGKPDMAGNDEYLQVVFPEFSELNGNLKYAKWNVGLSDWDKIILADKGVIGSYTSMAMDSSNVPHISYYDESNGWLWYAKWVGPSLANWEFEVVDKAGDVGRYTSITVDKDDHPHISYTLSYEQTMKYAWRDDVRWYDEDVVFPGPSLAAAVYSSISTDSSARPHIAYYSHASGRLYYTYKDGGVWQTPSGVDSRVDSGEVSLGLELPAIPHISYYGWESGDTTDRRLKYAFWSTDHWEKESVDPPFPQTGKAGRYSSLELEGGNPRISYFHITDAALRYAEKNAGIWSITPVDQNGYVGTYTSLELDSNSNEPRISYFDGSNGDLKYAERTVGSWPIPLPPPVDQDSIRVGLFSSLALEDKAPKDIPHIAYFDESMSPRIYHTRSLASGGEVWTSRTGISELTESQITETKVAMSGENVHVVWEDWRDYATMGNEVYYKRSTDAGDTWPGLDVRISDGILDPNRDDKNPEVAVSGATISVVWKTEMGTIPSIYSYIMYDSNSWNGDIIGWGTDAIIAPNPVPELPYLATAPDIAVIGNDRHIVYSFWAGSLGPEEIAYAHRIDSTAEKNPMAYLKGTSAVRAPVNWLGRDQIFIIGGVNIENPPSYSNIVWRYDPLTDTITPHCNLPYARGIAYTSATYDPDPLGEGIYVFGGKDSEGSVHGEIMKINPHVSYDCYDTQVVLPNGGRYGTSAVYMSTHPNKGTLIFGGYDGTPNAHDDIILWRPNHMVPVSDTLAVLPSPRAFTSAIVMTTDQEYAFVFGGERGSGFEDDTPIVRVYASFGTWVAEPLAHTAFPTGKGRSGTSAISDGSYGYVFGGRDESQGLLNDIIRFNPRVDAEVAMVELCIELPSMREYTSAAYYGSPAAQGGGTYIFAGGSPLPTTDVYHYVASYDMP
jgi:hypothetical protein